MAIIMNNSANITYDYTGGTNSAVSNITSTSLAETHSMSAVKRSQNSAWRPSENLTYTVSVRNDSTEPIYAISIQDDLGGTERLLTYVTGSAQIVRDATVTPVVPDAVSPLTITIPDELAAGESVLISYIARVKSDIDTTLTDITNTVTVAGHETSATGTVITVTPPPSLTLPKATYAEVRIEKVVDKSTAVAGDPLTYMFRLENSGNTEATNIKLRDNLHEKFTVESIKAETDGVVTEFADTDYSLDTDNRLILPTSTVKTLSVPAATPSGSGVTEITIVGKIKE